MPMTNEAAQSFYKYIHTFFTAGASSMGMIMGVNIALQSFDIALHNEWEGLLERFEDQDPIIGHTVFQGNIKEPFLLFLKGGQGAILSDLMLGGSGVPNSNSLSDMQVSALAECLNQMTHGALQQFNPSLTSPLEVSNMDANIQTDENLPILTKNFRQGSFYSIHGVWLLDDQNGLIETVEFIALLTETFAQELVQLARPENEDTDKLSPTKGIASGSNALSFTEQSIAAPNTIPVPAHTRAQPESTEFEVSTEAYDAETYASARESSAVIERSAPPSIGQQATEGVSPYPSTPSNPSPQSTSIKPIRYGSFDVNNPSSIGEEHENMNLLMDIGLNLHVELGRTQLNIKNILELTRGSVVELDRVAGEAVDLYANGKLIARGEVVVIEDNFGLRVTSIVSPSERLKGL